MSGTDNPPNNESFRDAEDSNTNTDDNNLNSDNALLPVTVTSDISDNPFNVLTTRRNQYPRPQAFQQDPNLQQLFARLLGAQQHSTPITNQVSAPLSTPNPSMQGLTAQSFTNALSQAYYMPTSTPSSGTTGTAATIGSNASAVTNLTSILSTAAQLAQF